MFNGKYTHINEILERVRRDYAFEEVFIDEAKEWVWDCIGYFGRPEILVNSIEELDIEDNRGLLPTDMYEFIGCREKSSKTPLIPTSDRYYSSNLTTTNTLGQVIVQGQSINIETTGVGDNLVEELEDSTIFLEFVPTMDVDIDNNYTYQISGNYIFTGITDVTIEIAYRAFPIWEDNTPKIPDDPKVVRMVTLFIAEKIAFRLMLQDKLSERKWGFIKDELEWAVGSAQNRMKMPNEDEMESIKNGQMRLRPRPNQWSTGFKNLNTGEGLKRM